MDTTIPTTNGTVGPEQVANGTAYATNPGSLVGTAIKPSAPAVVSSTPARETTQTNQEQLASIASQLEYARRQALILQQQKEADAAKLAATANQKPVETATEKALKTQLGVQENKPSQEQIEAERGVRDTQNQLKNLSSSMDSRAAAMIDNISKEYDGLIKQQEDLNKSYEGGVTSEGIVSGRARYAPLIQGGIITNAIQQGISKISALQAKKAALIMEAEDARDQKKFALLEKTMSSYRETIKEERAAAQETYERALAASQEARAIAKEQRDAVKAEADYASTIAPAVIADIQGLSPEESTLRITEMADQLGIDASLLTAQINAYTDEQANKEPAAIQEYNLAVNQGFKGSMLEYAAKKSAMTRAPKAANLLTAYEAATLGLPKSLVGRTEAGVMAQMSSPNIPSWFLEMNPNAGKSEWNSFRNSVPTTGSGSLSSSINDLLDSYAGGANDPLEE